ncbi:MAG: monoamine oxidase, partial [Nitrosarchaeum sp.]|nr:monoamine oxidase [Nitrosarchaeum sp.]
DFQCPAFVPGLQDPIKPENVIDSDKEKTYDVIVIGAGIAGLEAANELDFEGMDDVMVLETRDRIGGRVNTITDNGTALDLGASWIHGVSMAYDSEGNVIGYNNTNPNQNPIYKIAHYNNIIVTTTDGSTVLRYPSGAVEYSELFYQMISDFETYYEKMTSNRPDHNYTFENVLKEFKAADPICKGNPEMCTFAITSDYEMELGGDIDYIPAESIGSSQYFNNWEDEVIFPNGYNQIANCLAEGLNIKRATVTKINYAISPIEISTDMGIFKATHVVSTIPLGVLKENMTELFDPPFEQNKTNSINNLKMGTLDKTYLIFDKEEVMKDPYWDELNQEWAIRGDDWEPYDSSWRFFVDFHMFTDKPIILAFNVGSTAERLEHETDETIKQQIMEALRKTYPYSTIPDPVKIIRTSWATDPLSFGTYSFIPVTGTTSDIDELAKPVDDKLFFAGESTSTRYYGTVHGAYISGYKAAQEILNLNNNVDTIREQLDHGIHKDDICEKEQMLDDEFSEDPKCIPIPS